MDENTKLLTELRDVMKQYVELWTQDRDRRMQDDADRKRYTDEALRAQAEHARFYRRVVAVGAVLVVALTIVLFSLLMASR